MKYYRYYIKIPSKRKMKSCQSEFKLKFILLESTKVFKVSEVIYMDDYQN